MKSIIIISIMGVSGLVTIIFHRKLGHLASDSWYTLSGARVNPKGYQISFLIGGVLFIVCGLFATLEFLREAK